MPEPVAAWDRAAGGGDATVRRGSRPHASLCAPWKPKPFCIAARLANWDSANPSGDARCAWGEVAARRHVDCCRSREPTGMQFARNGLTFSPSDLSAFLACPHLTQLDLQGARGQLVRPERDDPQGDLIRRLGEEHEL